MIAKHLDEQAHAFLGRLSTFHKEVERLSEALNAFDNYVDPRDAYTFDSAGDGRIVGGGVGRGGPGRPSNDFAGFANEQELTDARELCRRMLTYNEFVINGHKVRVNYAVDSGFMFKAVAKDAKKADATKVEELQKFLDEFVKVNKWPDRQRETVLRYDRDGEVFRRRFQDVTTGMTFVRFIEPWQVTSRSMPWSATLQMGIETSPEDVETPVRYYVADTDGATPQPIEATEVQHLKANVDFNVRRGVPLFWPAGKNARRVASVLRNVGVKDELAAAMCLNRRHASSSGAASAMAGGLQSFTLDNPVTGRQQGFAPYGAGSILDTSQNTEYEALNLADGIDQMIMGLDAMLRALAAAAGLPEFMLTSNAANGNYSSTMVAEGPAVRTFRTLQSMLKEADLAILDEAVAWAAQCGRLPVGILDEVEIQVELPQLVTRDQAAEANANKTYVDLKVMSRQTVSSKLGLEYDQEQENIKAWEKENPQPELDPLGMPGMPRRGPPQLEAMQSFILKQYETFTEQSQ